MAAPHVPGAFVAALSLGGFQVRLHWSRDETHLAGSVTFEIDRSDDDGASWSAKVSDLGGLVTSWIDDTVTPNTNYKYRIKAHNGDGDSAYALIIEVTTPVSALDQELAFYSDLHNGFYTGIHAGG